MHCLSVIHGTDARTELFAPVVTNAGHRLDEWSFAWGTPPPRPLDSYDAVFVFGGAMHADQDEHHPWLVQETEWLAQLFQTRGPLLGGCPRAPRPGPAARPWGGGVAGGAGGR